MVKIIPLPKERLQMLQESFSYGMRFAWVSKDNRQATQLGFCKDYLHDAIWASFNTKKVEIYGFRYDPKIDPPIDTEQTRLLVDVNLIKEITRLETKEIKQVAIDLIDFLHQSEKYLQIAPLSKVYLTNQEGILLFIGSPLWMYSTVMISLYPLLMRIGYSHTARNNWLETLKLATSSQGKMLQESDSDTAQQLLGGLKTLNQGVNKCFGESLEHNWGKSFETYELHNNMGIKSYLYGRINLWPKPLISQKINDEDYYEE